MPSITHDVRYAARVLRARPGFTAALVATLALGIGATAAMFSLLDAALLRRLPFADSDRVVVMWGVAGPERAIRGASFPETQDWRTMSHTLTDVAAYDEISLNLRGADAADVAERVDGELVSASYFPLLGATAERGRTLIADDDRAPDIASVAVISHALWQRRFNADPGIIGRTVSLNERPFTVVGVMPERFKGISFDTDVWVPAMAMSVYMPASGYTERGLRWLMAVGRLKPGVTTTDAQRDLDAVAAHLTKTYPETNTNRGVRLMSLKENYLGTTGPLLVTLFASVLLFLLIACANVTSLQLVRATARSREIALRLALGATRGALVRQLLAEGVVIGALGAIGGVLIAYWAIELLVRGLPEGLLPNYVKVTLDGRALAFSIAAALACGILCTLVPAVRSSREDLAGALKEGARSAGAGLGRIRKAGAQQLLVVIEVALALLLLAGTGLMLRSLREQLAVAPGFRSDGMLTARVTLPRGRYTPDTRVQFAEQVAERLRAIPGVASASVSTDAPFTGGSSASTMTVPGHEETVRYYRHGVSPGYFANFGIAMRRGRDFTSDDRQGAPRVAIVSEAMATRFWPNEDAVGKTFHFGDASGPEATIVGVTASARYRDLTTNLAASEPDVFFPMAQRSDNDLVLAVRSRSAALPAATLVRQAVEQVDAGVPVYGVRALDEAVRLQSANGRFGSFMLTAFSSLALLLAAVGIYGVIAFVVGLNRREIAIRMALGARNSTVLGMIVRNGMTLVTAGVVLGLIASYALTGVLSSQLYGVKPNDPLSLASAAISVLLVALLASWLPARRAANVDPQMALRAE